MTNEQAALDLLNESSAHLLMQDEVIPAWARPCGAIWSTWPVGRATTGKRLSMQIWSIRRRAYCYRTIERLLPGSSGTRS
jgi:hypothetical protein